MPEMGDPTDGRPQQRIATRRNKLGEEVPRGGAYPPPASAKARLDLITVCITTDRHCRGGRV